MPSDPKTADNPWATGTKEWQMYEDQRALRERAEQTQTARRMARINFWYYSALGAWWCLVAVVVAELITRGMS